MFTVDLGQPICIQDNDLDGVIVARKDYCGKLRQNLVLNVLLVRH